MFVFLKKLFSGREKHSSPEAYLPDEPISPNIDNNMERISTLYGKSSDLVLRKLNTGVDGSIPLLIVHIEGLVNVQRISDNILSPISEWGRNIKDPYEIYSEMYTRFLQCGTISETESMAELIIGLSAGKCAILTDELNRAIICDVTGHETRSIDEPATEPTIRGSKEGFVETLRVNTSLIRRRIRSPNLRIEERIIGRVSLTNVAIAYIHGIAKEVLVKEVNERLVRIDIDAIQESGQLEELIEDAPFSPFPTMLRTERVDKVVANLLEGRLCIITDGTPFVLIVPSCFTMFLTSPEDYFERFIIGSAIRLVRFTSFVITLLLPSLYIAVTTFHQELLPTMLILSIASQREGVPFPAFVEALLMELTFETTREAGIRLPRIIGPVISIIGAMVIGDAAIRAGLASPVMVLVVAFTGIASFVIPAFSMSIGVRLIRFILMALAASMGFFGIVVGVFALLVHMVGLRSFGAPFMQPISPMIFSDLKDALVRFPAWAMNRRPKLLTSNMSFRQKQGLMPRAKCREEACDRKRKHKKRDT
jgi:spore germination protein KA